MSISMQSIKTKHSFCNLLEQAVWYSPIQVEDLSNACIITLNENKTLACNFIIKNNTAELYLVILSMERLEEAFRFFIKFFRKQYVHITRISTVVFNEEDGNLLSRLDSTFTREAIIRRHLRIEDEFKDAIIYAIYPITSIHCLY